MASVWYKFFSIVKIKSLFQLLLVGVIMLLCYGVGLFLAVVFDIYLFKVELPEASYRSTFIAEPDQNKPMEAYAAVITGNMF